jgi:rhamnose utilization protein RhaD (predicted bifunctional aldolase and dehydrogenase)
VISDFQALRAVSARLGNDPLLVQAAGGNTSIKQDGVMWIKASGTWLRDAATKDIFVPLDMAALTSALMKDSADCESCLPFVQHDLNRSGLRPSIETSVHGLMPQDVVLHVHCVNTIALAICEDARQRFAERLFRFNWSFIPYARPGLQLARTIRKHLVSGSNVMILQNHGLVVAADTVEDAEKLLAQVVEAVRCPEQDFPQPDVTGLHAVCLGTDYVPVDHLEAHAPALDHFTLQRGCREVFYPDHVVFLGVSIPIEMGSGASAVAVPGKGMLVRKDAKPSVEPMLRCLGHVFSRVPRDANLKALSRAEIDQLLNWDAETYRQVLQQPSAP